MLSKVASVFKKLGLFVFQNKMFNRNLKTYEKNRGGRSKSLHDKAVINCQYSVATFSGTERKNRTHGDWKSIEMTMHLKQTFEAVILTEKFPKSQIDIYVEVKITFLDLKFF